MSPICGESRSGGTVVKIGQGPRDRKPWCQWKGLPGPGVKKQYLITGGGAFSYGDVDVAGSRADPFSQEGRSGFACPTLPGSMSDLTT